VLKQYIADAKSKYLTADEVTWQVLLLALFSRHMTCRAKLVHQGCHWQTSSVSYHMGSCHGNLRLLLLLISVILLNGCEMHYVARAKIVCEIVFVKLVKPCDKNKPLIWTIVAGWWHEFCETSLDFVRLII